MNIPSPVSTNMQSTQVSITCVVNGKQIQLIGCTHDQTNYVADLSVVSNDNPLVTWQLQMAPDGTGLILDWNGWYLTHLLLLTETTSYLRLSRDINAAVHLITVNNGINGYITLGWELDNSVLLSINPSPNSGGPYTLTTAFEQQTDGLISCFQGATFAPVLVPDFDNIQALDSAIFSGEKVFFGNENLKRFLVVQSNGYVELTSLAPNNEDAFTLIPGPIPATVLITQGAGTSFLKIDPDGWVICNSTQQEATAFIILATYDGIAITSQEALYWNLDANGILRADTQNSWSQNLEFLMEFANISDSDRAASYNIDLSTRQFTACELAVAGMVWTCVGGLFLAAGLGPGIIGQTPTPGFVAFISANEGIATAMTDIVQGFNTLSAVGKAFAAGTATFNIVGNLYDLGIFWDVLKFLAPQLGYFLFYKVAEKALTLLLAAEAAVVAQVAALMTWYLSVIVSGINIINSCGPSTPKLVTNIN